LSLWWGGAHERPNVDPRSSGYLKVGPVGLGPTTNGLKV
jgi:hypothetical protein